MAKNKTTETQASISDYLSAIKDKNRQKDCVAIIDLIKTITDMESKMWGPSIVGFGSYHYKYDSGHEGDAPLVGLASRSTAIVLYLSGSFENRAELLEKLGKHKTEKGCVYIKTLTDIDAKVLTQMIKNHVQHIQKLYPS